MHFLSHAARRSLFVLLGTGAFFTWVGCGQIFGIEEGHEAPQSGDGSAEGAADGPAEGPAGDAREASVDSTAPDAGDGSADGSDASDAADAGDSSDGCPPLADASDFYVNNAAGAAFGACNRFSTIAAALPTARASTAKLRTIHLAAGTYSVATGESFPIVLRGGISVVGAGPGQSIVVGNGSVDVPPPKNAFGSLSLAASVNATFLVGDSAATTSISNLEIETGSSAGVEAIVCDRGNAASPPPAPNTIIDGVFIVGSEAGVRVTWSSVAGALTGCNALVRSSTLRDGAFGVVADGLLGTGGSATQVVSLQLGDSAGGGNTLLNFHYSNTPIALGGAGLAIADAVAGAVVRGNTFAADFGRTADMGIWALQTTYDATGLDIEGNTVGPLVNSGISLDGNVAVARLDNNTIQGVTMVSLPQYGWLGVGLGIGVWGVDGMPFVAHARNNSFVGNDIGVIFRNSSSPLPTAPSEQSDFGTASSPGGNSFHCNSSPGGTWSSGGDLLVDVRLMDPASVLLPFAGNVWDHAPPTTVIAGPDNAFANGTDVYEYGGDAGADGSVQPFEARIDVSNASTVAYPCPSGLVP